MEAPTLDGEARLDSWSSSIDRWPQGQVVAALEVARTPSRICGDQCGRYRYLVAIVRRSVASMP